MSAPVYPGGNPVNITGTGNVAGVASGPQVQLIGFYVNNTSSGTLVLKKGGSGGTAISGTITPAIGYHAFPANVEAPLHATIANTLDVTFFVAM